MQDSSSFAEAVRNARGRLELQEIAASQVLYRRPFCYADDAEEFRSIREYLAGELGVEVRQIFLVGSASTGFTLAPDRFPSPFHDESDFDFAIVSSTAFDRIWHTLLEWGHPVRLEGLPHNEQQWFDARRNSIFWGWLSPENLKLSALTRAAALRDLAAIRIQWFDTFQSIGTQFPTGLIAGRKVSSRLYRSVDHLLHYQAEGLSQLQIRLEDTNNGLQ